MSGGGRVVPVHVWGGARGACSCRGGGAWCLFMSGGGRVVPVHVGGACGACSCLGEGRVACSCRGASCSLYPSLERVLCVRGSFASVLWPCMCGLMSAVADSPHGPTRVTRRMCGEAVAQLVAVCLVIGQVCDEDRKWWPRPRRKQRFM